MGWTVGRNVQIEYRWGSGDAGKDRKNAAELVALAPDVILAIGSPTVEPLQQATRTVPIVFVQVTDPVGSGLVASMARPGGNVTGFTNGGIWHEREVAGAAQRDRRPACGERRFFGIPPQPPGSASSVPSRPWRRHSESN